VVVPVHNEAAGLEAAVRRLHAYLSDVFPLPWLITVADNASTDHTWTLACRLAYELEDARPALSAQLVRFASIGIVSTIVFALLFRLLVGPIGAVAALVVAFGLCQRPHPHARRHPQRGGRGGRPARRRSGRRHRPRPRTGHRRRSA